MKPTKQTVYLTVKVEDELPEMENNDIKDNVFAITRSGTSFIAETIRINGKLQDEHDYPSYAEKWLKPQEGYFFTPEELNQLLSDVIKDTLNTAAEKADLTLLKKSTYSEKPRWKKISKKETKEGVDLFSYEVQYKPSKKSITNTFDEVYQRFSVK